MIFLCYKDMGLIFWLYLHRVFRGTWSGPESIRFLVVGLTDQVVVGIGAYLGYARYRGCAMKTPTRVSLVWSVT